MGRLKYTRENDNLGEAIRLLNCSYTQLNVHFYVKMHSEKSAFEEDIKTQDTSRTNTQYT